MHPIFFIPSFVLVIPYVTCFQELNHKPDLNFGKYANWEDCPTESYARAFEIKGQDVNARNSDDLGMTGLRLFCDIPTREEKQRNITSGLMREGTWKGKQTCPKGGWLIGFKIRIQPYLGFLRDDSGANNMRMLCSTGDYISGRGLSRGSWSRWSRCKRGAVICGLRTKIEDIAFGDEMGLVALRMKCCKFKLPPTTSTTSTTTRVYTTTSTSISVSTTTSTTTPISATVFTATSPRTNLLTTTFNRERVENTTSNTLLIQSTVNTDKKPQLDMDSTITILNELSGTSASGDRKITTPRLFSRFGTKVTTEREGTSLLIFNENTTFTTPFNPILFSKRTTGPLNIPLTTQKPLNPSLPSRLSPSTNKPEENTNSVLISVTGASDAKIQPGNAFIPVIPTPAPTSSIFVSFSNADPDKVTEESQGTGIDKSRKNESINHHDIPKSQTSPENLFRSDDKFMPDIFTSGFVQSTKPSPIKFPTDKYSPPSSMASAKSSSTEISNLAITTVNNVDQRVSLSKIPRNDDHEGDFFGLNEVITGSSNESTIKPSLHSNSKSTPNYFTESTLINLMFPELATKSSSPQNATSFSPQRKVDLKPRINFDGLQEPNRQITSPTASFPNEQASDLPQINSDLPLTFGSTINNPNISKPNQNKDIENERFGKDLMVTWPSILNNDPTKDRNFTEKELTNLPINDTNNSFDNRQRKSITLSLKGYDIDISDKMEEVSHPVYLMLTLALLAASLITVTWLIYAVKKGRKKSKRRNKVDPRHKYLIKVRPVKQINNDKQ